MLTSQIQEGFTSITTLALMYGTDTETVITLLRAMNMKVIEATKEGFAYYMQRKHGGGDTGADKLFPIRDHSHFLWKRVSEKMGRNVCGYNFEPNSFVGEYVDGEPLAIDCDRIGVLDRDLPQIEKVLEANKKEPAGVDKAAMQDGLIYDIPSQAVLARMCGVGPRTVSNWMKLGLLFDKTKGREKRFSRIHTAKWLEQMGKNNELELLNKSK